MFDIAQGLRNVEGMRAETVRKILVRAEEAFAKLVERSGDNKELLLSQAAMLSEFADTYAAQAIRRIGTEHGNRFRSSSGSARTTRAIPSSGRISLSPTKSSAHPLLRRRSHEGAGPLPASQAIFERAAKAEPKISPGNVPSARPRKGRRRAVARAACRALKSYETSFDIAGKSLPPFQITTACNATLPTRMPRSAMGIARRATLNPRLKASGGNTILTA